MLIYFLGSLNKVHFALGSLLPASDSTVIRTCLEVEDFFPVTSAQTEFIQKHGQLIVTWSKRSALIALTPIRHFS